MGEIANKVIEGIKKNKKFKDVVVTTGDDHHLRIDKLSFDVPGIDELLSGGLPFGRMCLMYGEFSTGKTFLCLKLIANAQTKGKSCVIIDIDKCFEPDWCKTVGVDISDLVVVRPDYGEQAFELVHSLLEQGIDLIVMDSLDLLVPTAEAEATMDDSFIGLQARCIATGLRKAIRLNTKSILVCTNHVREGIGRFSQVRIPGGKAQEDFSSVMMWIARGSSIKEADIIENGDEKKKVGFKMRITLEKDKVKGKQWESCELPFIFEGGVIDTISGLMELCIDLGIIKRSGAKYKFFDQDIFGKLNVRKYLAEHEDVQEELRKLVKKNKVK